MIHPINVRDLFLIFFFIEYCKKLISVLCYLHLLKLICMLKILIDHFGGKEFHHTTKEII